jgi:ABC-type ATPase involved in cell division
MATHDLDIVRQASHRTIELEAGAIVYDSGVDDAPAEAPPA